MFSLVPAIYFKLDDLTGHSRPVHASLRHCHPTLIFLFFLVKFDYRKEIFYDLFL